MLGVHTGAFAPHSCQFPTIMDARKGTDMLRFRAVLSLAACLLMIAATARAADNADTPEARMTLLKAQMAAGEFGPAIDTAQQATDAAERSMLLSAIADAQMQTGDFDAALGAIRRIPDPETRTARHKERARQQGLAGGTGADFQTLIELI